VKNEIFNSRIKIVSGIFFLLITTIFFRYLYLGFFQTNIRKKLLSLSYRQTETEISVSQPRANITDRNGRPLAMNVVKKSLFFTPKEMPESNLLLNQISTDFKISLNEIKKIKSSNKSFAWVQRKMDSKYYESIEGNVLKKWKDFAGIIDESHRFYPNNNVASHVVGYVGLDNQGLAGIELAQEKKLKTENVKVKFSRDARGKRNFNTINAMSLPQFNPEPLSLTIDLAIQKLTEQALENGVKNASAKYGSAIVLHLQTGEILSMASFPPFNPNTTSELKGNKLINHAISDGLELGSVIKPLVIARALELKKISESESLFCENGKLNIPGGTIHDTHPHEFLFPKDIIKVSSNICLYKIAKKIDRQGLFQLYSQAGFTRAPGTGLPSEWAGQLASPEKWKEMRFANLAFGQGIAISPLQLTQAIGALGNNGEVPSAKIMRSTPLKSIGTGHEEPMIEGPKIQIAGLQVSKSVLKMMRSVVDEEGGTGALASIENINVAGKTGTAQKFMGTKLGYSERTSSFIGLIPAENPKLVITVIIDEPQMRPAYGGKLAGPVFAEIAKKTALYMNSTEAPWAFNSPLVLKDQKAQ
jgi:cell division protein FtsI (penicillin-binding protein 3)